jgi:hypothetical protein
VVVPMSARRWARWIRAGSAVSCRAAPGIAARALSVAGDAVDALAHSPGSVNDVHQSDGNACFHLVPFNPVFMQDVMKFLAFPVGIGTQYRLSSGLQGPSPASAGFFMPAHRLVGRVRRGRPETHPSGRFHMARGQGTAESCA